jgi:hypothetical protein
MSLVLKKIFKSKIIIVILIAVCVVSTAIIVGVTSKGSSSNQNTPDEVVATADSVAATVIVETNTPITTCASTTIAPTKKPTEAPTEAEINDESEVIDVVYTEQVETPIVENNKESEVNNYSSGTSDYELDLLARTIYQEAGICSEYCQWLVGSTVLNLADERGGLESVVFDYNTFNVAYVLYDAEPSDLSYSVASRLLSGDRDCNVKAFRMDYYHNFGTPYTNVDGVYFSTY